MPSSLAPRPADAPVPSGTWPADATRRAELVAHSAGATSVITLMLALARFVLGGRTSAVGWVLLGGAVGFAVVAVLAKLGRTSRLAAAGLPTVGLVTLTTMAYLEGGLSSDATVWFAFLPIVAALLIGRRATLVFAALAIAALGLMASSSETSLSGSSLLLRLMAAWGAVSFGAALGWFYERARRRSVRALQSSQRQSEALLAAIPDTIARVGSAGEILEVRQATTVSGWSVPPGGSIFDWSKSDGAALRAQLRETLRLGIQTQDEHMLTSATKDAACEVRMAVHADDQVVAIIRDVSERRRLARLKEDFIATVSHELRTPLTGIVGSISLLKSGTLTAQQTEAALDVGERSVNRLERLVGDLLDFQSLEHHPISLLNERVDVAELLHELAERHHPNDDKRIELVVEAEGPFMATLDIQRLRRILEVLLSNAVKFSPAGSTVSLDLDDKGGALRILVEDQGPGIPQHTEESLFAAFSVVDCSDARERYGLGIGLALAQRIAKAMGARLGYDRLPTGSRFWVELPSSEAALAMPTHMEASSHVERI